jgi:hypothetical protein
MGREQAIEWETIGEGGVFIKEGPGPRGLFDGQEVSERMTVGRSGGSGESMEISFYG